MPVSKAKRAANNRWDSENMAYQTVKVKRVLLERFKAACAARKEKVNTVLCNAMEQYANSVHEEDMIPQEPTEQLHKQ